MLQTFLHNSPYSRKYDLICGDSGVFCVYCQVTNFSLSGFGYWISGKGTISHSSSVVAYLIAHTNFGSAQNGVFAVSQIRERNRFGCDVN